jgi:hypothetical protein
MTGGQGAELERLARSRTGSGQPVRDWLAHKKRRRWHLHFTPTSSSWRNLVECWFSVLSRQAVTNTSFTSVAVLETRIDCWVSDWNDNSEAFVWTKPADEILDKVARGRATLDRITKSDPQGGPEPGARELPGYRPGASTGATRRQQRDR